LLAIDTILSLDLQYNYIDTNIPDMTAKSRLLMRPWAVDTMSLRVLSKVNSGVYAPVLISESPAVVGQPG
jgi:hypothetical protein